MKIPKDMIEGTIHKTNNCGDVEVVEYLGAHNIIVRFKKTGTTKKAGAQQLRLGKVKDSMHPVAQGFGFIGRGKYSAKENSQAYRVWHNILQRCYNKKAHNKTPTYKECTVDAGWYNFQNFAKWYEESHPNDGCKWEIDKDILIVGNKVYGPESCLLLPHWMNSFTISCNSTRGSYPVGVSFENKTGMFRAKCSKNGKTVSIGRFSDPEAAHLAWRKYKLQLALDKKPEMDAIDLRIYPNVVQIITEAR